MKVDRRLIFNFDWMLVLFIALIVGIGVLNLYSAGHGISGEPYLKQIRWVLLGLFVMVLTFAFDYRWIARYAYVVHGLAIVLLIAVFAVGAVTKGSQRWINLGGFSMQPSEMVKITLILALAKYFNDHRAEKKYGIRETGRSLFDCPCPLCSGIKAAGPGDGPDAHDPFRVHGSFRRDSVEDAAQSRCGRAPHHSPGVELPGGVPEGEGADVP